MSDRAENASNAMQGHISSVVQDNGDGMVTKWTMLAEVINTDGGREMWTMSSDGLSVWDAMGMLEFALQARRMCVEVDGEGRP